MKEKVYAEGTSIQTVDRKQELEMTTACLLLIVCGWPVLLGIGVWHDEFLTANERARLTFLAIAALFNECIIVWLFYGSHWWYQTIAIVPRPWPAACTILLHIALTILALRLFINIVIKPWQVDDDQVEEFG